MTKDPIHSVDQIEEMEAELNMSLSSADESFRLLEKAELEIYKLGGSRSETYKEIQTFLTRHRGNSGT